MKYSFAVASYVTFVTVVEADFVEDAVVIAQERSAMSLPAMAHGDASKEWVTEVDCDAPGMSQLEDATDENGQDITKEAKEFWEAE